MGDTFDKVLGELLSKNQMLESDSRVETRDRLLTYNSYRLKEQYAMNNSAISDLNNSTKMKQIWQLGNKYLVIIDNSIIEILQKI